MVRALRSIRYRAQRGIRQLRTFVRRLRLHPQVTEDLVQWSRAHGLDVVVLSPGQSRTRVAPIALGDSPDVTYAHRLEARVAERVLVCLPNARLWGRNGLIVLPDGSYAAEAIYGRSHLVADPAFSTRLPTQVVRMPGDYVTLLGSFSNTANYYHWMHDGLLRLHHVREHVPPSTRYLVPLNLRAHQRETLSMLGLKDEEIVGFPGDSVWDCERLWFPSLPPSGSELPEAVEWLRERLWTAAGVERTEPRRRVYLSRAGCEHGRVVNEDALLPVLEKYGFNVVHPERMSVAEQVQFFAGAEAIMSPTSAALANLLFAGRETSVIEILEPEWAAQNGYVLWTLAETVGQPFWYLMAESVPNPVRPKRLNLSLSPARLDHALEEWLRSPISRQRPALG